MHAEIIIIIIAGFVRARQALTVPVFFSFFFPLPAVLTTKGCCASRQRGGRDVWEIRS